jgi:hypothetical protein
LASKLKPLSEGFVAGVSNNIRQFFARAETAVAAQIQRGGTPSVERAGLPFNLVSQFGYDSLAEHLRIDQDLQARFTDYEEMDEYPEISCISGHLRLPNLTVSRNTNEIVEGKTIAVKDLCEAVESGRVQRFFVYAIDHAAGRVVAAEAKGIKRTGVKVPVVRVVYEDYRRSGQWELVVTADHLCMLRDGSYRAAGDLKPDDRLMPCTFSKGVAGYARVREPLQVTEKKGSVYTNLHGLVMRAVIGRDLGPGEVTHHIDEDKANPHPMNLELRDKGEHAAGHVAAPGDDKRRKAIRQTVAGKWMDPSFKLQVAKAHQGSPKWLRREADGEHKHREATGTMSDAHRQAISAGRTIDLSPSVVEAAVRSSASFNDAARKVGVSWNTLMRRMNQFGLDRGVLGSLLGGPVEGEASYANHRVVSVEPAGTEDVYDIEVPGYHNFAVGDVSGEGMVFVHNSAYDIYADDSAMPNEKGHSVWISSDNQAVERDLMDMLHKRVRIEDDVWGLERTISKYGNSYGEMLVAEQGLVGINFLPPPTVRRVEGPRGELLGFIQDIRGEFNISLEDFYKLAAERGAQGERRRPPGELTVFEDWELVHWRLRGKHMRSIYGHGIADGARWIWKRLSLLEDALLIYKLSRAPARYAFYVDIGEYDHERGLAYVNRVKNQFIKHKFVNPNTGKMDMRHSPLCLAGDTVVPLLDGSAKSIEEISEAHGRGEQQWVWGCDLDDGGKARPVKVAWAGVTRRQAQIVRIVLDNGESIRVTPDHKMIRRSGEKVEAQHLEPGDSLMPFRRKISTKSRGDALEGYELVYCPKSTAMLYGHRVVARDLGLSVQGQVAHHVDLDRLNNDPRNLEGMWPKAHRAMHVAMGQSGGRAIAKLRQDDEALDARLRQASRKNMISYNRSEEHRRNLAGWNKDRDQGRFIRAYNGTEKHTQDNEIRKHGKIVMWADPERRASAKENMRIKFPTAFVDGLRQLIRENPGAGIDEIATAATEVLIDELRAANTRSIGTIHRHMLCKVVRSDGFGGFAEFGSAAIADNHKVASIEWLDEPEDTYTLTVEPCHTFALKAGIFVCNSHDEDFFIPSRGGKDSTRIELLQGPDYAETDTVEYHRDKLVSAIKVPKSYLGYGGEATKSSLSSEDIRFARTVMRIQRETRSGIRKACRVHLVAKGADVDRYEYDAVMSVPSAILELAKLEVMSATADLAQRVGEILSTKWVLTTLFKYSEEEAEKLMHEKDDDALRKAKVEAETQKMLAIAQAAGQPQPEGEGEGGEEGEQPPAPEPSTAPQEGRRRSRSDILMLERRMSDLIKRQSKDTRDALERKMDSRWKAEDKVTEALKQPDIARRMRRVESLLGEVRAAMRPTE